MNSFHIIAKKPDGKTLAVPFASAVISSGVALSHWKHEIPAAIQSLFSFDRSIPGAGSYDDSPEAKRVCAALRDDDSLCSVRHGEDVFPLGMSVTELFDKVAAAQAEPRIVLDLRKESGVDPLIQKIWSLKNPGKAILIGDP